LPLPFLLFLALSASYVSLDSLLQRSFFPSKAASHPHLFQPSITDENEICKLVANHFVPDRAMLQWHLAAREDIPTPNMNEIMVFSSFFNADSASRPAISSADSLTTTKLK
jgi:hypothetical protein